jgi:hypothetical protein
MIRNCVDSQISPRFPEDIAGRQIERQEETPQRIGKNFLFCFLDIRNNHIMDGVNKDIRDAKRLAIIGQKIERSQNPPERNLRKDNRLSFDLLGILGRSSIEIQPTGNMYFEFHSMSSNSQSPHRT